MNGTEPWHPPRPVTHQTVVILSPRQADVLCGIVHGHSNAEIGERLFITENTVKTIVKCLLRAMGARTRGHAAALACSGQLTIAVRTRSAAA